MKGKIKEFFKPTVLKFVVFIVLIISTVFIPKSAEICSMGTNGIHCSYNPAFGFGYPIFLGGKYSGDTVGFGLYPLNLIMNIIIYYSVSCIIITIGKHIKIKKYEL